MTVQGWRAWYSDGRVFDSRTVTPDDLPKQGLQIIVLYGKEEYAPGLPYREILCGGDYLTWDGFCWRSVMSPPTCPTCRIFPGSWMSDAAFDELQQAAFDWLAF